MTPDDTPVPGDDAIARAAREGLRHLAGSHAPIRLNWMGVALRARRVRQCRLAVVVAACAIVLTTGGVAVATTGNHPDHVSIAGHGEAPTTTTTTEAPTSTSTTTSSPTSTTSLASIGPSVTTEVPTTTVVAPDPKADELAGTLTLADTTLTAEQPTSFTLTLQNTADHPVTVPTYPLVGVWIDTPYASNFLGGAAGANYTLAAGERRTFTSQVTPAPEMIGAASVHAAILVFNGAPSFAIPAPEFIPAIAPVPVTILPPDYAVGRPLDPSLGKWAATVSTDASDVHIGDSITVNATLRNVGGQAQLTQGYGSLMIVCANSGAVTGVAVPSATVQSDATQTFAVQLPFPPTESPLADYTCSVRVVFHGDVDHSQPRDGIDSNSFTIAVLPATSTTTTLPNTSTTSP